MSEEYLVTRKTALLGRISEADPNVEKTIEQLAKVNQALGVSSGSGSGDGSGIDTSVLARETTLTGINNKLPALSGGRVPVSVDTTVFAKEETLTAINNKFPALSNGRILANVERGNVTSDWRIIPASISVTIPAGYVYIYLLVLSGSATINSINFAADDFINLEPSPIWRHPAITIVTAANSQVRIIGGY